MKSLFLPITTLVILLFATSAIAQDKAITRNTADNTISSIVYNSGEGIELDKAADQLTQIFELDASSTFKKTFSAQPSKSIDVVRYAQWYKGIKVEHGSVSVMAKNGRVTFMNADIYKPANNPNTTATITEADALQAATNFIGAKEYMWEQTGNSQLPNGLDFSKKPEGILVWVQDYNVTGDELDRARHLAYKFDIYASEPMSRSNVYVDATTGKILLKDLITKHVAATGESVYSGNVSFETNLLSGTTYSLEDFTNDIYTYNMNGGTNRNLAIDFTNSGTTWGKSYALDVHWGSTMVKEYWLNEHNRNSFDGSGADIVSYVGYGNNYNNAFWNGSVMTYGDGTGMFNNGFEPLVCLDVCSHEIAHAVCQHTSGLVYARESGAMNEGFSDIWGAVVEEYATDGKQTWSVGEELRVGALRSMSDPNLFNDPKCHSGTHWKTVIGCSPNSGNDQCGVHSNSGVLNHWFYLLSVGGKGTNDLSNSFEVAGLGIENAATIAYQTELVLTANATYSECRTKSINVATTLYGSCSREVEAVTRAWYAVGVGAAFSPCAPQLSFNSQDTTLNKVAASTNCPAATTYSIPLSITGGTPAGGNAVVTFSGTGTAANGTDYQIMNSPITFNAGSTASQNLQVQIFDNGDITDKQLTLYYTIAQNGSDLSTGYTYDSCFVTITGSRAEPDTGADYISQVNTADISSKAITPFFSRSKAARMSFVISAEELVAAGVRAGEPITSIQFNVTQKNSTQAFSNFGLKIGTTAATDLTSGVPTTTTTYFSGSLTTQLGWNDIPLSSNYTWNGTDNLVFETCFTNTNSGTENDYIEGVGTLSSASAVAYSTWSSNGCGLSYTGSSSFFSISKPVIRIVQPTTAIDIEKTIQSSRAWEVNTGHNVYFTSTANDQLIANVANPSADLGCVNAYVTKDGIDFEPLPAPYAAANRSKKEFSITASKNQATAQYDITVYFDTSELSTFNNVRLVATSASADSLMDTTNTQIVAPLFQQNKNSYFFKAQYTGIEQRYFLTDRNITLKIPESVHGVSKNTGRIQVINNPFADVIYLSHSLQTNTIAQITLLDITGKVILSYEQTLTPQQPRIQIDVNKNALTAGNYILQVVTPNEVMTQKMLKQ